MAAVNQSFAEAVNGFREFLRDQGRVSAVRWLFREDVTVFRRSFKILDRARLSEDEILAAQVYEIGRDRGLGVRIDVACFAETEAWSYVWVPKDEVDASYAMMTGGLRYGFPTSELDVCVTHSTVWFRLLKFLHRMRSSSARVERLPSREEKPPNQALQRNASSRPSSINLPHPQLHRRSARVADLNRWVK